MLRVTDRGRNRGGRRGGLMMLLALVGGGVLLLIIARMAFFGFDLPDWMDGGESDPAARGQVIYEGQTARSASENFLVDIGDGEAVVAVSASQDWDTPGWWVNGDFQSTNGTSSVQDPDDGDEPARLRVTMDYCAQGTITNEVDEDGNESVTFDMGEVFVCNATLEHTRENDAAFHQDDTPADFHGDFVSFVAGAVETTAAAAECPTDELERFSGDEYVDFVRGRLSEQYGVDESQITIETGRVGRTDAETQDELREALESYANRRDPDDPEREYEALDIEYFSGDGSAVEDSCWRVPGGEDLDSLESVGLPEPEQR